MKLQRSRISSVQNRLGAVQDRLRLKLVENQQYLISDATDLIRIKARKDYQGDDISWICERADVINAIFPPMTEVPFRKIRREGRSGSYQLTSLVSQFDEGEQQKNYTLTIPLTDDVDVGDLFFRITDIGREEYSIVVILQARELLGTFAHSHIILQKVGMVIPTDEIPPEILDVMVKIAKRRGYLGW